MFPPRTRRGRLIRGMDTREETVVHIWPRPPHVGRRAAAGAPRQAPSGYGHPRANYVCLATRLELANRHCGDRDPRQGDREFPRASDRQPAARGRRSATGRPVASRASNRNPAARERRSVTGRPRFPSAGSTARGAGKEIRDRGGVPQATDRLHAARARRSATGRTGASRLTSK